LNSKVDCLTPTGSLVGDFSGFAKPICKNFQFILSWLPMTVSVISNQQSSMLLYKPAVKPVTPQATSPACIIILHNTVLC